MFEMMSELAEFERAMIDERVKVGLSTARAKEKKLGIPSLSAATEAAILRDFRVKPRPRSAPSQLSTVLALAPFTGEPP